MSSFFGKDGRTSILQAGPKKEILDENRLWQSAGAGGPGGFAGEIQYGVCSHSKRLRRTHGDTTFSDWETLIHQSLVQKRANATLTGGRSIGNFLSGAQLESAQDLGIESHFQSPPHSVGTRSLNLWWYPPTSLHYHVRTAVPHFQWGSCSQPRA